MAWDHSLEYHVRRTEFDEMQEGLDDCRILIAHLQRDVLELTAENYRIRALLAERSDNA
jgi:hypothetical protein